MKTIFSFILFLTIVSSTQIFAVTPEFKLVEDVIEQVEVEISARIGVSIFDAQNNTAWNYKGTERFPITSTFKTLVCAKLLNDANEGKLELTDSVIVESNMLQEYSPVTKDFLGKKISLKESCAATMLTSDNTAGNIVLEAIGGPLELTKFIRSVGDDVSRLDRMEPELNEGKPGDIRDTTSPVAITETINELFGSPRVDRRLIFLRGLDNETKTWIFSRSTGTRGSVGVNH